MAKLTPFQKISGKLVRAKVFRNTAILKYNFKTYNWETGEDATTTITREIQCYPPEPVNQRLVDGKNYLSDDQIMRIPYTEILNSRAAQTDDPVITNNGKTKTLEEMRPYNATTGGIATTTDTIEFSGKTYHIAAVRGDTWMGNAPADYYFTLRG